MKILTLMSSFRKTGNTAHLVALFHEELKRAGEQSGEPVEIETLQIGHMDLGLCRGCRVCFDLGEEKCPLKDELLSIKEKILAADGIIAASPVYVDDVNGIMKNLIDRLAHVCHRPQFAGKTVYLLATTGGSPAGHTLRTLSTAWLTWGSHLAGAASFITGGKMPPEEIAARYQEKIAKGARKFFRAVHQERYMNPSIINLMVFRTQQQAWSQAPKDSLDFQYWERQGWTDPRRNYYVPHQANALKTGLARAAGRILSLFMA